MTKPVEAAQDILGYTLQKRIGSGGFGEVWSAVAPGGLQKAVKIVYGFHDEKRAMSELKSLERVKDVRHPFLLSLERIEVFSGQLIVITELADKSLADLFNEYVIKGEPGIPREMLIKYVSNTADALDYLSTEHSLQHLDVKPENLLVVSGHVKVADFGLMKDLRAESQSLMQGMTPAYAAPELFDGQPTPNSDQYSLAILYQEMLTGVRPFPGTTPAQLAAQHMHGKPNLRPLPPADQQVIAKALSKDPNVRYPSCADMVAELSTQRRTVRRALRRSDSRGVESTEDSGTVVFGSDSTNARDVTEMLSEQRLPFQRDEITAADPPECDAADAVARPTIIVGVGATANRVVKKIKQQLLSQYGTMDRVPSVRLLCIDSDRTELARLVMDGSESLSASETLEVPLKKPEDYRGQAGTKFGWLSRRWIYNVPRTLQTEGLRPLGRLAFADHFQAICDSLEGHLAELTKAEHLATTADSFEMSPGSVDDPQVFIVTSISGGVGSGMTLDLAYTLKLLLAEKGIISNRITGLLLHSTYQRSRDPGLSAANAFAFLTELRHYNECGYPGDTTLGIPEFVDEAPFDLTYYNDLGHDLNHSDFEANLASVAQYILLSTNSPCSAFFDASRRLETETMEHFSLRTFGLSVSGPGNDAIRATAVDRVGCGLVNRWLNGDSENARDVNGFVDQLFSKYNLQQSTVISGLQRQADSFTGERHGDVVRNVSSMVLAGGEDLRERVIEKLDQVWGKPRDQQDVGFDDPPLCVAIEEFISVEAINGGESFSQDIIGLLKEETIALTDLKEAVELARVRFDVWSRSLDEEARECDSQATVLLSEILELASMSRPTDESRSLVATNINQLCDTRKREFSARYAREFIRVLSRSIEPAKTLVAQLKLNLESVAHSFTSSESEPIGFDEQPLDIELQMSLSVQQNLREHIIRTESQVYHSLIADRGGYQTALSESGVWQRYLPETIRDAAQRILSDAYSKISLDQVIVENEIQPEQLVRWLDGKVHDARPAIFDCGGAVRLLIGLPRYAEETRVTGLIQDQFRLNGKTIHGTCGNLALCFEGEDVSLASVAFRLLEARPDAVELVRRIHTRMDIDWTTLNDLL